MIEYFETHMYAFWFTVGFSLFALELLVLGAATGFVLFLGLGALLTGGLLWIELIPPTWLSSIATFTISSIIISTLLWKPFIKLQHAREIPKKDNTSDLVGHEFRLTDDITFDNPGVTRYSGIEWHVYIDNSYENSPIKAGTLVTVTSLDAGKFYVVPAQK